MRLGVDTSRRYTRKEMLTAYEYGLNNVSKKDFLSYLKSLEKEV